MRELDRRPTARVQSPFLFKEHPIYEQSAARGLYGAAGKAILRWSRQPLKIAQLRLGRLLLLIVRQRTELF